MDVKWQAIKNLTVVICSGVFIFSWQMTIAAEDTIQIRLDAARSIMQQLDELAEQCVAPDEQSSDIDNSSSQTPCLSFSQALNGEMLIDYIDHCAGIKIWRDQFIDSQTNNSASNDTKALLELMIDTELLCGEDAMIKRTEFVGQAYQMINNANRSNLAVISTNDRELRALRQQMMISQERNRLMNSFQQQQQRQQFETQRQLDRQELELIRQQIVPPTQRR
jgi:hypothetical protein